MAMARTAEVYADFLLPYLASDTHLVDVGCGSGELSLDLARRVGAVTGIDMDPDEVSAARREAGACGVTNTDFRVGDAYASGLPDDCADAVLAHSVFELLDRPGAALAEMRRLLKPGGVLGLASVDYAGLILTGPHDDRTHRFYEVRERLWALEGADPYLGRRLRGLLLGSGFVSVAAETRCISYGTAEGVREFGLGRAEDCSDPWYVDTAERHGLATRGEVAEMRRSWTEWSESPDSYAAFAWCRAVGRKPEF